MEGQPTTSPDHRQAAIHKHLLFSKANDSTFEPRESLQALIQHDPIWLARWIINLFQHPPTSREYSHVQVDEFIDSLSQSTSLWLRQISHLDPCLNHLINHKDEGHPSDPQEHDIERLGQLIKENQEVSESCSAKWFSLQIETKWEAYNQIYHHQIQSEPKSRPPPNTSSLEGNQDHEEEETEHWGDLDLEPIPDSDQPATSSAPSFFSFHQSNLDEMALSFASKLELDRLIRLLETGQLKIDLFSIFDAIPLHARTSDLDYGQDLIALLPRPTKNFTKPLSPTRKLLTPIFDSSKGTASLSNNSLTDQQLTNWYLSRVEAIDEFTGSIDTAIEIMQHGAASGVIGLESIAEDLSLLSKLIYDVQRSPIDLDAWTLKEWRSKSPDEIVQAYLSASSPTTLIKDVHRLVLPYLGVLESRRARASIPGAESTIPDALRTWALGQSNRLAMLEALINASSPTLKLPERLIKSNRDLAQILIACLYTSSSVDEWECMGRMFECMPAFPDQIPSSEEFNSANWLHELLTNQAGTNLWTSEGTRRVYDALVQLDIGRVSSILDGLDDHLTTAEVLARWNVPVRLGELVIKFHRNKVSQQKLATRIARQEGGIEMESEEEWEVLLEAMIELSQPGRALDLLEKNEVIKLFFSGLLTSGKFKLAKSLFSSSISESVLDANSQEELVIAASREFYDNAETANLHTGEMKMAYDCLSVAPQTLNIKREREFIEASCRLASFNLESLPGIPMSPIEIRLKPNKLELISQLLQVSRTAYQYQDMIIDLVNKLGYGEDLLVQTKALSMVVDFAVGERDLSAASSACERMLSIHERIKKRSGKSSESNTLMVEEVSEVTWKTCERVGKYSGVIRPTSGSSDLKGFKTKFLGHAITICPPDQIPRLLLECKAAEIEEEEQVSGKINNVYQDSKGSESFSQRSLWGSIDLQKSKSESGPAPGSSSSMNHLGVGLPGGDLASRTLERAASLFPFNHKITKTQPDIDTTSLPSSSRNFPPQSQTKLPSSSPTLPSTDRLPNATTSQNSNWDSNRNKERDFSQPLAHLLDDDHQIRFAGTDRLTAALSNKFTSGVGWLIGASEEDLNP